MPLKYFWAWPRPYECRQFLPERGKRDEEAARRCLRFWQSDCLGSLKLQESSCGGGVDWKYPFKKWRKPQRKQQIFWMQEGFKWGAAQGESWQFDTLMRKALPDLVTLLRPLHSLRFNQLSHCLDNHWDVTHARTSGQRPFVHLLSGLTEEDTLCACASEAWQTPPEHFDEAGGQFTLLSLWQSLMQWKLNGQISHFHMTAVNAKLSRTQCDDDRSMHP